MLMKKVLFTLISSFFLGNLALQAQVTISGGTTAAGSYTTLSAAVSALNAGGALTAPVVIGINGGYTENLTSTLVVNVSGTAANPLTFQKSGSGANPLIAAPVGTVTLSSTSTTLDGIWAFNGSDYVTIDGIDLIDNNTMTAGANNSMPTFMEYGYGFFQSFSNRWLQQQYH